MSHRCRSPSPNVALIEEYRADRPGQKGYPDAIASTGFMTLALVFHPDMQKDFDLDCEGQADWHGQPTWSVHFRQRHDRPNRMHSYTVGGQAFPVDLKGQSLDYRRQVSNRAHRSRSGQTHA